MYIPKKYGQSKIDKCPFCEEQATATNFQGVPVCRKHKNTELKDLKCVCGSYVDIRTGKYGLYFNCLNCGNINSRKIFEMNHIEDPLAFEDEEKNEDVKEEKPRTARSDYFKKLKEKSKKSKETTVRSDDPRYF